MYKCLECGHIFDKGEEAFWEEPRGEYWGTNCREIMVGCPLCRGVFEETKKCAICKSEHLDDDLIGGVCEDCIDSYRKNFEVCYGISRGETEKVEINSLLACIFDSGDIEQILKEYVLKNCPNIDCSEYIDADITWFGERIAEEVNK